MPALLFLFIVLTPIALCETQITRWYQVDLVFFENLNYQKDGRELRSNTTCPVNLQHTELWVDLASTDSTQPNEERLKKNEEAILHVNMNRNQMKIQSADRRKIDSSGRYKVIYEVSWQQPPINTNKNNSIRIVHTGMEAFMPLESTGTGDAQEVALRHLLPLRKGTMLDGQLIGSVSLKVAQLMYIDLEICFQRDGYVSHLSESRKLKLNELNFFDDPVFGVLILVSPIEKTEDF